jgi:hypothetical protein
LTIAVLFSATAQKSDTEEKEESEAIITILKVMT